MAEYNLSYTASEIDEKLGMVDALNNNKLNVSDLNSAIDTALAEAKASGEFDGSDGVSATHSWNGTTLTVTSASGTSSVDLKGEKGEDGAKGEKGDKGYTPVRGVDYFTDDDKIEVVNSVVQKVPLVKIPETPIFVKSVDEMTDTSKVYVLNGNIYAYMKGEGGTVANFTNKADPTSASWKEGYRINSSNTYTEAENMVCTNWISYTKGDIIRVVGMKIAQTPQVSSGELVSGENGYGQTRFGYSNDGTTITGATHISNYFPDAITVVDGVEIIDTSLINLANPYFCLVGVLEGTSNDVIVTVNEEITYSTGSASAWTDTGLTYTATIYTDLIGIVDENNIIYMSTNNLPSGTYTLKYGDETYETIGTLTVE